MHFLAEFTYITPVTIRRVDGRWVEKAKADAKERGVSMDQVLVDELRRGLGVEPKKKTNGLERFVGTMTFESEEKEARWDKFINEELNEITAIPQALGIYVVR